MKIKLATWYMEKAWLNLGSLRNVHFLHKLFNLAYGARKAEFMAQILAVNAAEASSYQRDRGMYVRELLRIQGVR